MKDYEYKSEALEKFNKFEKIFFKIELVIVFMGIGFFALFSAFIEKLGGFADLFISIFLLSLMVVVLNFVFAFTRIIKFLVFIRKEEGPKTIWRSFLTLLLSPLAFILYYMLIFLSAFSSCGV